MFNATISDEIISKSKNIFWIFFCISWIYIKICLLWKKNEPERLFVFEIIDCKKRRYLMPEKSRTKTLLETQHVKQSEKLHKPSRQYFCHIFLSLWKKISSKSSVLEKQNEPLRLFLSEIIDSKKWGYLNAQKAPCQNTYGQSTC